MRVNPFGSCSRALRALSLVVAASTLGCSDSLSPLDVAGAYTLETRDGASLPVMVYADASRNIFLVSETLVFRAGGRGTITWVQEHRHVGGPTETITSTRDFSYEILDDRIEITMICGPLELCTPPPHLVLSRSSRGLQSIAAPGTQPMLSYVRVSPGFLAFQ
jgi:hypothetical protein